LINIFKKNKLLKMEALTILMEKIDLNSKVISEGDYLEMCNSIKEVHKVVKQRTFPQDVEYDDDDDDENQYVMREVMRDDTLLPPVPFSTERSNRSRYYEDNELSNADADADADDNDDDVVMADATESDDLSDVVRRILPQVVIPGGSIFDPNGPEIRNFEDIEQELRELDEQELGRLNNKIRETQISLSKLKIRQRITENVRKMAVQKRARELGIRLHRNTIGALLDKGHNVGNARVFYKQFLDEYNEEIEYKRRELTDDLEGLLRDKDALLEQLNLEV
tara:strand:- start:57 stop:896 length:840 start_codon:yes stop_codon:yes gene_type:complete